MQSAHSPNALRKSSADNVPSPARKLLYQRNGVFRRGVSSGYEVDV